VGIQRQVRPQTVKTGGHRDKFDPGHWPVSIRTGRTERLENRTLEQLTVRQSSPQAPRRPEQVGRKTVKPKETVTLKKKTVYQRDS